jgi:hypothetical protein
MRARLIFVATLLLAPLLSPGAEKLTPLGANDFAPLDTSVPDSAPAATPAPIVPATAPTPADTTSAPPDSTVTYSTPPSTDTTPSNWKTSYELDAEADYVGGVSTSFGRGINGNVSEQSTSTRLLVEPQYNDGPIYRFGLGFQRYNFGLSRSAPLPNILQSENLVIGMDFNILTSWLIRIDADPGLYGDARANGFRDFNVPFELGGSYIASETVQWILGLSIDANRQLPVIPAIGVHWSLSDNWVVDAVLPTPRIEYDYSKALTLYLGGDFDDGTYRVDQGVGTALGRSKLSDAVVEYDEIHVGAGFSWQPSKAVTLELEGGYLPYREFDFHRANDHFSNNDVAPYGRMSFNAQF